VELRSVITRGAGWQDSVVCMSEPAEMDGGCQGDVLHSSDQEMVNSLSTRLLPHLESSNLSV
jgi:hypothetical protein